MSLFKPRSLILSLLIGCIVLFANVTAKSPVSRNVRGKVYYSNNTPDDLATFPVELWSTNQKTQIAKTTLNDSGQFFLSDIPSGKYLLKISHPGTCTLIYRVDLRQQSITNIRIVIDAACAHTNGKVSNLPKN